jgi:hypothetical protein
MFTRLLVAIVALQVVAAPPRSLSSGDRLSDWEVLAAIESAQTNPAGPRELRFLPGGPVVAVAYSPTTRIGTAARFALARGRVLSLPEASGDLRERVVYIAIRDTLRSPDPRISLRDTDSRVYLAFKSPTPNRDRIEPLWLSRSPSSVLGAFGASLPFPDIALVAAFPMAAVQADWWVVASRQDPTDRQLTHTWVARFTADDVAALRPGE